MIYIARASAVFFSVPTQKIIQMPLPTRVGDTNWMCLSTNLIILARSCALTLHICNVQGTILIPEYHFFVCTFTLDVLILILKFSFSEKATKIWKNLPLVLMLLSTTFLSKQVGDFFQILWPSHNIWTLHKSRHLKQKYFLASHCV